VKASRRYRSVGARLNLFATTVSTGSTSDRAERLNPPP